MRIAGKADLGTQARRSPNGRLPHPVRVPGRDRSGSTPPKRQRRTRSRGAGALRSQRLRTGGQLKRWSLSQHQDTPNPPTTLTVLPICRRHRHPRGTVRGNRSHAGWRRVSWIHRCRNPTDHGQVRNRNGAVVVLPRSVREGWLPTRHENRLERHLVGRLRCSRWNCRKGRTRQDHRHTRRRKDHRVPGRVPRERRRGARSKQPLPARELEWRLSAKLERSFGILK